MEKQINLFKSLKKFYKNNSRNRIMLDYKENVKEVEKKYLSLMTGNFQNKSLVDNEKNIEGIIDSHKVYDALFNLLNDDKKCYIIHNIYIDIKSKYDTSHSNIIVEYEEFHFETNTDWKPLK